MAIQRRDDATTSEADSYERATAFLSDWIEDSFLVPTATAKIGRQGQQHHQQMFSPRQPVPDLPLPPSSRPLRRRNNYSSDDGGDANEGAIHSLVHSLRTSLMFHEHQNQNRLQQRHGITSSPSSVGAAFNGIAGVPPPPFSARPTATQQQQQDRDHQQGAADVSSRRSAAPSFRSTRRRSTGDVTARPEPSFIKHEHGSKHHYNSSSKHEKSSKGAPRSRRRTFDCDRSFTSSSCASVTPPNQASESLLKDRSAQTEDVLHFSVSMSSLYDGRRPSSQQHVHWSNRSDDDLLSPSPSRDHHGGCRNKDDPPTMVVSLPWTDHAGNVGRYTGEVNTLVQPHGSGALQYDSGRVLKGLWNNGNPTTSTASAPRSSTVPLHSRTPVAEKEVIKKAVTEGAVQSDGTAATASRGVPPSRKTGDEKKRSSKTSNHPTKTKSSRKKSRGNTNKVTEDKPSANTTKSTSTQPAQPSLERLCELDGPPNFDLGDTYHSNKYQIIESNPSKALNLINQLRIHDFAWILRSSREWTYAIIADFPMESGEEASIRFVIDKMGNTKTLKMKHWVKCIRLVDQSH
mmetsp:Transcript_584/g.958  ORF Transcript_584/g.958 Transcript_584/m.958 type:complete len:573 (-) Transcript_584:113-1831(-)